MRILVVVLLLEELMNLKLRCVEVVYCFWVILLLGRCRFLVRSAASCMLGSFDELRHFIFLIIQLLQHLLSWDIKPRSTFAKHLGTTLYHLLDWLSIKQLGSKGLSLSCCHGLGSLQTQALLLLILFIELSHSVLSGIRGSHDLRMQMCAVPALLLCNDSWLFTHVLGGLIACVNAFLLYHLHKGCFRGIQRASGVWVAHVHCIWEALVLWQCSCVEDDGWWIDCIIGISSSFLTLWS